MLRAVMHSPDSYPRVASAGWMSRSAGRGEGWEEEVEAEQWGEEEGTGWSRGTGV